MALKPYNELPLDYIIANGGGRWRKLLDNRECRQDYIHNLKTFLNDVPECRKVPAYLMLGDTKTMPDTVDGTLDSFYAFYSQIADMIDEVALDGGDEFSVTQPIGTGTGIGVVTLYNYSREGLIEAIAAIGSRIVGDAEAAERAYSDYRLYTGKIVKREVEFEDMSARLETMSDGELVNLDDRVADVADKMVALGFQPMYINNTDTTIEIVMSVLPRLMYDVAGGRDPLMTLPMGMMLTIDKSDGAISLYRKLRFATNYYNHPHIGNSICWGSIAGIQKAELSGDYDTLLTQFDKLVRNYNSGSPYITYGAMKSTLSFNGQMKWNTDTKNDRVATYINKIISQSSADGTQLLSNLTISNLIGSQLAESLLLKQPDLYNKLTQELLELTNDKQEQDEPEACTTTGTDSVGFPF